MTPIATTPMKDLHQRETASALLDPSCPAIASDPVLAEPRHFEYVDALRGAAFLSVFLCHASQLIPSLPTKVRWLCSWGQYGVELFFVVSAFTLCLSLHQRAHRDRYPLRYFFVRRFFRIAPLFWAGALFYLCWNGRGASRYAPDGVSLSQIVSTFLFAHGWYPTAINSVVPGGWSVAVEVNFYCLLPLLLLWMSNIRRTIVGIFLAVVTGVILSQAAKMGLGRHANPDYVRIVDGFISWWLPAQMAVFMAGIALFHILQIEGIKRTRRTSPTFALLLMAIGSYLFAACAWRSSVLLPAPVGCGLALMLIVWGLALRPLPLLVNPVTCYLGRISFSAYLSHFAVLQLVSIWILRSDRPAMWSLLDVLLAGLAATVLVSTVTYYLIEEPGRGIGRRIIRRFN